MAEKTERTAFIVTGNRLADGRVVYLRDDRSWGPDLDSAELVSDAARRDEILPVRQREDRLEVTGIYSFDVGLTASGARILSTRERLRAQGESQTRRRLGLGD